MDKTCLQAVRASSALGCGKVEWLNRDGKSGLEQLRRERELNGGVEGGIRMPLENLLEEKANYEYPCRIEGMKGVKRLY